MNKKISGLTGNSYENNGVGGFLASLPEDEIPILVEIDPPTHLDFSHLMNGARSLKEAGVNAVTLGENPLAILRAGNLGPAHRIKEELGLQAIIHQTCRDSNILGLQSRLMEAHCLGIEAVLAVTGDTTRCSDQPDVSGVFNMNSFELISLINKLNNGENWAGEEMRGRTDFSIGAAFCYRPKNPDMQISRLEKKAELGARFAMTQPLFAKESVEEMLEKTHHIDMMIFPGIFPLLSRRNAEFLHGEVPGISVPAALRAKLAKYEQKEDQRKMALEYTGQLVADIAAMVDGFYFISPLNQWEVTLEFVQQLRNSGARGSGRRVRAMVHN